MSDEINHPQHYTSHPSGVECIEIAEHFSFCVGNAVKYLWRAGLKGPDALVDLHKARWYIDREITRRERKASEERADQHGYDTQRIVELLLAHESLTLRELRSSLDWRAARLADALTALLSAGTVVQMVDQGHAARYALAPGAVTS